MIVATRVFSVERQLHVPLSEDALACMDAAGHLTAAIIACRKARRLIAANDSAAADTLAEVIEQLEQLDAILRSRVGTLIAREGATGDL